VKAQHVGLGELRHTRALWESVPIYDLHRFARSRMLCSWTAFRRSATLGRCVFLRCCAVSVMVSSPASALLPSCCPKQMVRFGVAADEEDDAEVDGEDVRGVPPRRQQHQRRGPAVAAAAAGGVRGRAPAKVPVGYDDGADDGPVDDGGGDGAADDGALDESGGPVDDDGGDGGDPDATVDADGDAEMAAAAAAAAAAPKRPVRILPAASDRFFVAV
jgi:hypothetical protein